MAQTDIQTDETGPLRVLIADDVQETRRSTRLMMTLVEDARVIAIAQDGKEAVAMSRQMRPDIAVMDINMPELDGLTAIQQMLQDHPNLFCIVISAERTTPTLQKAMAVGARDYLIKPFTVQQLVTSMERAREAVLALRQKAREEAQLVAQRNQYLEQLAIEYIRDRRSDDEAVKVLEELAAHPHCAIRWLRILAMVYVIRQEWGKLRRLAAHLEKRAA
ncbi:MAG: response regulator [Anaerolineae bacterium]|nr:response regulator [Anaerolineae bacterium]